jgi:hypothetical protein
MNALSRRDTFAMAALTGLLANYSGQQHSEEDFARWAFLIADAMEEESKTKGGSDASPQ